MRDFFEFFGPVALVLAVLVAGIIGIAESAGRYTCNNYERMSGKETRWVALDSCYVQTAAGWQRWDEYTARAVTNEATP